MEMSLQHEIIDKSGTYKLYSNGFDMSPMNEFTVTCT